MYEKFKHQIKNEIIKNIFVLCVVKYLMFFYI